MEPARPLFYLVRHAEAERTAGGDDARRRLTAHGRETFGALARELGPGLRVARVLCSPYARARETAEILGTAAGAPVESAAWLAPGRSTGWEILERGRDQGEVVALVGHNPEMAEAITLGAEGESQVLPGALASVEVREGRFHLLWLRVP